MKVVNEITQCKLCYNLIQVPVLLVCCSESICQKHIDEIKSKNIESKFICSLCDHEHEHDIFPLNKAIEKLLSTQFFDVDKLALEDYGGEAMDQIEKTTDIFRKLKNDLLLQKTCKLSKTMDINKFTQDFSDEFKIESRLELNFWSNDFLMNYFLLFFFH